MREIKKFLEKKQVFYDKMTALVLEHGLKQGIEQGKK